MGFDFSGLYTRIVEHRVIESKFGDRVLAGAFIPGPEGLTVREVFDPNPAYPVAHQRGGWQAGLGNFKKYVGAGG